MPPAVWKKPWVVYAKPTVQGEGVACAISRAKCVAPRSPMRVSCGVDATTVTFRYQDATARARRTMTLPGEEFLRRFLQHGACPARPMATTSHALQTA